MKRITPTTRFLSLLCLAFLIGDSWVRADSAPIKKEVGRSSLFWHNKATGQNRVWLLNGTNLVSQYDLPTMAGDPSWRMVGTGDFNQDQQPDIVWQNDATGQNLVWLMRGTNRLSTAAIDSAGDLHWKMVGVADFDGDGKPDLVWQNTNTAENVVWNMNGTKAVTTHALPSNGDPKWRIIAAADFNRDGKPDLLLHNISSGQIAIWYLNGLKMITGEYLKSSNGTDAAQLDPDWKIVGTDDYNGDGKPDLLWRHSALGVHACWFLNGSIVTAATYLGYREGDTDWKVCGQDPADASAKSRPEDYTWLRGTVSTAPPKVSLTFKVVPHPSFGVTVQRRANPEAAWVTLVSGSELTNYVDATVTLGQRYDYKVFREAKGGVPYAQPEHLSVALNAPPLENRGRIVLLIDKTLSDQLTAGIDQLKQDLVGDGWSVVRHDVPRQVDDYSSPAASRLNAFNVTNVIKPLIRAAYQQDPTNTRAVFLVGHVAIPYSGTVAVDGHNCTTPGNGPDHRGAWPADMFYGDLDGEWTDHSVNYTNCNFTEATNLPGDGKFDQDSLPSPYILRLAVGRLDFARLPIITEAPPKGVPAKSEAALINQYLKKDHLYRSKLLPWQRTNSEPRDIAYGHFHDSRDSAVLENAAQALPAATTDAHGLTVGDFCFQRNRPYMWGFLSGAGYMDRINNAIFGLEHTSADLANPVNEPTTAFYMVLGSFLGDWNLSTNNFLRCLLATPNYGLASIWTRYSLWRLDTMGVGETLGEAFRRMVNDPKDATSERSREKDILGDPTLRLHVLAPPVNLTATQLRGSIQLRWDQAETGSSYLVYRSATREGPFSRISTNSVSFSNFTDARPDYRENVYMVRAAKLVTVGTGSYTNLSQGTFVSLR